MKRSLCRVSDFAEFNSPISIAVMAGLIIGKPLGTVLSCWLVVKTGITRLPAGIGWGAITGGGFLAGIGFTMALFIAGLALDGPMLGTAKVGILPGSVLSAIIGSILLMVSLPNCLKYPVSNHCFTAESNPLIQRNPPTVNFKPRMVRCNNRLNTLLLQAQDEVFFKNVF